MGAPHLEPLLAEDRTLSGAEPGTGTAVRLPDVGGSLAPLAVLAALGVVAFVVAVVAWLLTTTVLGAVLALAAVATLPVVLPALVVWVVTGGA